MILVRDHTRPIWCRVMESTQVDSTSQRSVNTKYVVSMLHRSHIDNVGRDHLREVVSTLGRGIDFVMWTR